VRVPCALALVAACGGDDPIPVPPEVTAGPVTITTDPFAITVAGAGLTGHVAIGTVAFHDASTWYDPRDLERAEWTRPTRATAVDGDWLVLEGGARVRLTADAVADSASIELDASAIDRAALVQLVFDRAPGEPIYGFGESFGGADASGEVREAQFRIDTEFESSLNEAHVPVPLALWPRRGGGLFVEDRRSGAFDVGARAAAEVSATFNLPERGPYRVHVFTAAEPLDLTRKYVALTTRPAVPPRWAFAPMQWRNVHDNRDQVLADAQAMRSLGIPDTTIWIDNPWQTAYNTFVFDENRFVDPPGLIAELTAMGYKVLVWSTPYLHQAGPTADDHAEAAAMRYLVTDLDGRPFPFPWEGGVSGLIDFTRPGAIEYWQERIARVTSIGIDGFKLDYGEDVVPELGGNLAPLLLAAGDAQTVGSSYQRGYHDAYLGALPPGDGFVLTRAGGWGEQDRNTAIWPGDLDNDLSHHGGNDGEGGDRNVGGLPAAIAGGTSLAVSGYPFYGSDIGGYRGGVPDTEVLIRWSQYAALGTIMQLGGAGANHNPWDTMLYQPPALAVYQEYARLHMDLNPYLWTLALAAGADGTPTTPPARFVYDCACDDAMFLLGDAILVAPVIEAGATTREVVLPPGAWRDWWSGELVTGDGATAITVPAPLTRMPIWQRDESIVPMFARPADTLVPATTPGVTSYADPAFGRELRLRIAPSSVVDAMAERALHDGGEATVIGRTATDTMLLSYAPGTEYDLVTFDVLSPTLAIASLALVGATPLASATDEAGLLACPSPGCFLSEPGRLRVRLHTRDAPAASISF
jgi:alpha-D-xyloside xylohydrolase